MWQFDLMCWKFWLVFGLGLCLVDGRIVFKKSEVDATTLRPTTVLASTLDPTTTSEAISEMTTSSDTTEEQTTTSITSSTKDEEPEDLVLDDEDPKDHELPLLDIQDDGPVLACDSEWTYFNYSGKCYKLFVSNKNLTWFEAERRCRAEGGHLAPVQDEVENGFLTEWTRTGLIYRFSLQPIDNTDTFHPSTETAIHLSAYIGGLCQTVPDGRCKAVWVGGSNIYYKADHRIYLPHSTIGDVCLVLLSDDKYWEDGKISRMDPKTSWIWTLCDRADHKRFVCQKESKMEPELKKCEKNETHVCGREMVCPSLWTYFEGTKSCYQKGYIANKSQADRICGQLGGTLATIETFDEYTFLKDFTKIGTPFPDYPDNHVWIDHISEDVADIPHERVVIGHLNATVERYEVIYEESKPVYALGCLALMPDAEVENGVVRRNCLEYKRMYVCKKPGAI